MKKYYHTFVYVLNKLVNDPHSHKCKFEHRPAKYKFSAHNYGEIPKWHNRADGDPWDIFAPGYKQHLQINRPYIIDKVIGVFMLENGNHKIAVRLKDFSITSNNYEKDIIKSYTKKYSKHTKVKGKYISINKLVQSIL